MLFPKSKQKAGFTLIELLVVIAIIGLLASIVLASLNSARAKSRDAVRKAAMTQVQTALEMYAFSNNGLYPSSGGSWRGTCSGYGGYPTTGATGYIPNLAPTYIPVLPTDPANNPGAGSCYLYLSDGVDYKFLAHSMAESYPASTDRFYDPARPTWAWKLCSKEPACSGW